MHEAYLWASVISIFTIAGSIALSIKNRKRRRTSAPRFASLRKKEAATRRSASRITVGHSELRPWVGKLDRRIRSPVQRCTAAEAARTWFATTALAVTSWLVDYPAVLLLGTSTVSWGTEIAAAPTGCSLTGPVRRYALVVEVS